MLLLTLSLVLAAEPSAAGAELKLAAPGLIATGIDSALAGPLTDHLAKAFAPIRVITARDISVLLGLERQKELLGCAEGSDSCIAELGNALGVQGVLLGDIVKLGKAVQINVRVIDPVTGRQLASASTRVDSEEAIFDALTAAGLQMRAQFTAAAGQPAVLGSTPSVSSASPGTRRFAPIPFAIGGAALITGAICLGLSESVWQQVTAGPRGSLQLSAAQQLAGTGKTEQTVGTVFVAVGLAAAVAGVGVLVFGSPAESHATIAVAPDGIVLAGSF